MLYPSAENDGITLESLSRFRAELLRQGWTEGKNVQIEYRFSSDADRLPSLARALVELQPDAIFVTTTPAALALMRATQSIPVVFVSVSDPVGTGLARSLAQPGGNMTCFANAVLSLSSKWLELLKEIDPRISRVGLMFNPDTAANRGAAALRQFSTAAPLVMVKPIIAEVRSAGEIEAAIAALAGEPRGGLIVTPDVFNAVHRAAIVASAARHRVPAVYPFNFFGLEGGLMTYGVDPFVGHGQAASYISRILKGEKPGDLPIQQPTKFELIINLKAAKALGLEVPSTLLSLADQIID